MCGPRGVCKGFCGSEKEVKKGLQGTFARGETKENISISLILDTLLNRSSFQRFALILGNRCANFAS